MLNEKKLYTYFDNKFTLKKSTNGWYSMLCPYCAGGKKAEITGAVQFEHGLYKCWRAKCGIKKNIIDFIIDFEKIAFPDVRNFIENYKESSVTFDKQGDLIAGGSVSIRKEIDLPVGYSSLLLENSKLAEKARQYLKSRGFDVVYLDKKGWGFCNEKHKDFKKDFYGYIIIPIINSGKLVYYHGRDFLKRNKKWKYKNPEKSIFNVGKSNVIFNADALLKYQTVFLSEGALNAETVGKQGIATLGWSISKMQMNEIITSQIKNLVIAADIGFYKKAVKFAMQFLDYKNVKVISFDVVELSEFGDDINSVGREKFMQQVAKVDNLTFKEAIRIISN